MPKHCHAVQFESDGRLLVTHGRQGSRVSITGCRDALNGYQKGSCFYCYAAMMIGGTGGKRVEVDHFLPHLLKKDGIDFAVDESWNLVLACQECNAGEQGKFAKVPDLKYLDRLHTRNEYLIESHHPLRETIVAQTGNSERKRTSFLQGKYNRAIKKLISTWSPPHEHRPTF